MRLLHKNLLFASALSFAVAGFLGSSSASALDEFSLSDIIGRQQKQMSSRLTSPLSMSADCESANPDSTISCNESPSPELLFNRISNGEKLWGHDGKGVVFADSENLVDGNPQLRTASRGDTVTISEELITERYYDDEENKPFTTYMLYGLLSPGLTPDQSSISVKVDGQELSADEFELMSQDMSGPGYDFKTLFAVSLSYDKTLNRFSDNATIELTYSVTINSDAPSEVFIRGLYQGQYEGGMMFDASDMASTSYQANALLEGGIAIRRIDASGNPVVGAKYTIDGVKANKDKNGNYVYDENGAESIFETNSNGRIIITNVPFGAYSATEVSSPTNNEPIDITVTRDISRNIVKAKTGSKRYIWPYAGIPFDITDDLIDLGDGRMVISEADLNKLLDGDTDEITYNLTYNEQEGFYEDASKNLRVRQENGSYYLERFTGLNLSSPREFTRSDALQKNVAMAGLKDVYAGLSPSVDSESVVINGNNAIVHYYGEDIVLPYDEEKDEYSAMYQGSKMVLKKCGTGYQLELWPYAFMHFEYSDYFGKYMPDYPFELYALNSASETEVNLTGYYVAEYYPDMDRYYLGLPAGSFIQMPIDVVEETAYATEFLFQERDVAPEDITNPQTSDTALKLLAIIAFCIAPIAIVRKQLSKR